MCIYVDWEKKGHSKTEIINILQGDTRTTGPVTSLVKWANQKEGKSIHTNSFSLQQTARTTHFFLQQTARTTHFFL